MRRRLLGRLWPELNSGSTQATTVPRRYDGRQARALPRKSHRTTIGATDGRCRPYSTLVKRRWLWCLIACLVVLSDGAYASAAASQDVSIQAGPLSTFSTTTQAPPSTATSQPETEPPSKQPETGSSSDETSFLDRIRDLLDGGASIVTVLGFGLVGVFASVRRGLALIRSYIVRRRDRSALGPELDRWTRLVERDPYYDANQGVVAAVKRARREVERAIVEGLNGHLAHKLDHRVSGTVGLTKRELLSSEPSLLLPVSYDSDQTPDRLVSSDAASIAPALASPNGVLVVGPAGSGKSILCLLSEMLMLEQGTSWPVLIEKGDFAVLHGDLGSRDWLVEVLARRMPDHLEVTPLRRQILFELCADRFTVIVDSLDEIAARVGPAAADVLYDSWVFDRAKLVTVRTSHFESALLGHPEFVQFPTFFFTPPDEASIAQQIEHLCVKLHGDEAGRRKAVQALEMRDNLPGLREVTQNPLVLTMLSALDTLPASTDVAGATSVSSVYAQFVRYSVGRMASVRTLGRKAAQVTDRLLMDLAWRLQVDPGSATRGDQILDEVASGLDLIDAAVDVHSVLEELVYDCPLIDSRSARGGRLSEAAIHFQHESFQDYLVARRFDVWLHGADNNGDAFFEHIETPEITFFVKEMIAVIRGVDAVRNAVSGRLRQRLEMLQAARQNCSSEAEARLNTFAAGQVAYYLGLVANDVDRQWLRELVDGEEEFWIVRSAAIGLLFGGDAVPLNSLIQQMWAEIEVGDFTTARKSVSVELGFYGDQPFDPLDPVRDCGLAECGRLVSRSFIELKLDVEAANWRMILFNLLYLAEHREISRASFRRAFRENLAVVDEAIEALSADEDKGAFPEVGRIRTLLSELSAPRGEGEGR